MDAVSASRLQFGLTLAFHYLFPPITIGLGVALVMMERMYLRTRDPLYQDMTRFWAGIFGLNFALGVATGIPMEFQFGTNWAQHSRYVGDVFGSALAAEGIFAFFLAQDAPDHAGHGWHRAPAGSWLLRCDLSRLPRKSEARREELLTVSSGVRFTFVRQRAASAASTICGTSRDATAPAANGRGSGELRLGVARGLRLLESWKGGSRKNALQRTSPRNTPRRGHARRATRSGRTPCCCAGHHCRAGAGHQRRSGDRHDADDARRRRVPRPERGGAGHE